MKWRASVPPSGGTRVDRATPRPGHLRRDTPALPLDRGRGVAFASLCAGTASAAGPRGRGAPLATHAARQLTGDVACRRSTRPQSRLNRVVQSRNRAKNPPTPQNRGRAHPAPGPFKRRKPHVCGGSPSGASRARTGDLLHAMQASGSPDFGVSAGHSLPPAADSRRRFVRSFRPFPIGLGQGKRLWPGPSRSPAWRTLDKLPRVALSSRASFEARPGLEPATPRFLDRS